MLGLPEKFPWQYFSNSMRALSEFSVNCSESEVEPNFRNNRQFEPVLFCESIKRVAKQNINLITLRTKREPDEWIFTYNRLKQTFKIVLSTFSDEDILC